MIVAHLADHYAFYGEAAGVRIARKHLGWYTKDLAAATHSAAKSTPRKTTAAQLARSTVFFDPLAVLGERLDYRAATADLVDACEAFGRARQASHQGGEALAA